MGAAKERQTVALPSVTENKPLAQSERLVAQSYLDQWDQACLIHTSISPGSRLAHRQ